MKKNSLLLTVIFICVTVTAQTKKIQPFTGTMTIENGISYDEQEIKLNEDFLCTANILLNKKISEKLIPAIPQSVLL